VYGVSPKQVVGSSVKTRFDMRDGRPELVRLPEIDFIDDGPGKPVGINTHIGQRPIAAFGNSDSDQQMLQWTTMASRRSLGMLINHTDGVREYAYDRVSSFGASRQGPRCRADQRLVGPQHEGRLEADLSVRAVKSASGRPVKTAA
jgi:hypothetical protein